MATDATADRRRSELSDFLKKRRAALTPTDVGLPNGGRRRTPGLRREEVALIAGVGTTWYTWLEQGRDVRASLDVLEAIAGALRMTPAERAHLIVLGRGEEPPPCPDRPEYVSETMRGVIAHLGHNPAFLLGRRWDYLAWNPAAEAILGPIGALPDNTRNHVWQTFMDPARRLCFGDWEEGSRLMVAKFRADAGQNIGDPRFDRLIHALRKSSKEFCDAWKLHEVVDHSEGRKILSHPIAGRMVFEMATLRPQASLDQRLILYTPLPDENTQVKLTSLLTAAGS